MKSRLTLFAVAIGFAFLAGSVFIFFDDSQFTKVGPSLIESILSGFGLLWIQITIFMLVFTTVYALAGWLFAWSIQPLATRLTSGRKQSGQLAFLLLLIAMLWMTLETAGRFPHSMLGLTLHEFSISSAGRLSKIVSGGLTLTAIAGGLAIRGMSVANRMRKKPALAGTVIITITIMGFMVGWLARPDNTPFPVDPDRPHVVLVGIDGWRLDTLPRNGGPEGLMPFVEGFMNEAAVIEEAYTPLARTFPAWWSVFTGQFPVNHGARFNLVDDEFIQTDATLPRVLGDQGYHRLFAMDEFRFANFRTEHGFDQVIGPCVGAADFLLGGLTDTPLTNLLANHWSARYLFPCTHANRAAYITYEPDSFDRLLDRGIRNAPRQPLFLITHFELPHWPFLWASGPAGKFEPHPKGQDYAHYMETLELVDLQVEKLFTTLESLQVLDNAIVVILSDHGEAFDEENLIWTHAETGQEISTLIGHGTDVLGLTQHQVPLAFLRFGDHSFPPGVRKGQATLADILPTLIDLLGLDLRTEIDGRSLIRTIEDPAYQMPDHPIAIETGFNPSPSLGGAVDESTLLAEGMDSYRALPDGRLTLRPEMHHDLLERKQRAVILGDRILTLAHAQATRFQLGAISTRALETIDMHEPLTDDSDILIQHFCRIFAQDFEFPDSHPCHDTNQLLLDPSAAPLR